MTRRDQDALGVDGAPIISWEEQGLARLDPSTLSVESERTFPDHDIIGLVPSRGGTVDRIPVCHGVKSRT